MVAMNENVESKPSSDPMEQIRRAHASARPTRENPAWANSHADLAVALQHIEALQTQNSRLRAALDDIGECECSCESGATCISCHAREALL